MVTLAGERWREWMTARVRLQRRYSDDAIGKTKRYDNLECRSASSLEALDLVNAQSWDDKTTSHIYNLELARELESE